MIADDIIHSSDELLKFVDALRARGAVAISVGGLHVTFAGPLLASSQHERELKELLDDDAGKATPPVHDILSDPDLYGGQVPSFLEPHDEE